MMLLLCFLEGLDGSFIDVWTTMTTIVLRLVDERNSCFCVTDCQ